MGDDDPCPCARCGDGGDEKLGGDFHTEADCDREACECCGERGDYEHRY